jgi:hypothetical protein
LAGAGNGQVQRFNQRIQHLIHAFNNRSIISDEHVKLRPVSETAFSDRRRNSQEFFSQQVALLRVARVPCGAYDR